MFNNKSIVNNANFYLYIETYRSLNARSLIRTNAIKFGQMSYKGLLYHLSWIIIVQKTYFVTAQKTPEVLPK